MNREEFCELMAKAKEVSGRSTTDISFDMRMQWSTLARLEKGKNNFGVEKMLQYVDTIKHHVFLKKDKERICIKQYKDIVQWLKNTREKTLVSQSDLATAISCSRDILSKIENEKIITSIDIFLKLAEFFEYEITLEPKK